MKVRKKPIVVDAVQYTGDNKQEIMMFTEGKALPCWEERYMIIPTLEGEHMANAGDWIIKGIKGEFYPIKHDIFLKTYDEVEG